MSELIELDAVVIGGGVIGLAIGRKLAELGHHVLILEAETALGAHTSSRNSEVIHSGIYYATGSLKATLCVAGRKLLYAYCEQSGVEHARTGKLIVATREEEIPALSEIKRLAEANDVHDLRWLDQAEIRELEPAVSACRGLFSPSTGIIDSHGFLQALRRDAEARGADVALESPLLGGQVTSGGFELRVGGREPVTVRCKTLVNAAGLRAQEVARAIEGVPQASIPPAYYAKGHYFVLNGASPFRHLVYPVPVPGGLGVHVTLDLAGQARFGPDVSWVTNTSYDFDEAREGSFYEAIRRYYPLLRAGGLSPGYTGIRPKLGPRGTPAHDFLVQGPRDHGVPGLVSLYGIESPGLTASLALAEHAARLLTADV